MIYAEAPHEPFRRAAEHARGRWGVVSLAELRDLGVPRSTVRSWLRRGLLLRLHPGVYALGHAALRPQGHRLAAVLACGPGTALSHAAAAHHLDLRSSSARLIDVSTTRAVRPKPGLRIHRPRRFEPGDVIEHDGIPTTSATRTVIDMASALSLGALESLVAAAQARGLLHHERLAGVRSRKLRLLLGLGAQPLRSKDERRLRNAVRAARLPEPEMNVWMSHGGGEEWQADMLFRRHRVIVEIDDDTHKTHKAFELDRHKDAIRQVSGFATVRFTRRQLREDLGGAVALLARLLADRE